MTKVSEAQQLEKLLFQCSQGDRAAAREFIRKLSEISVVVPERFQEKALSDAPNYPNDFFNLLGIKDQERNTIPVFSREELLALWSGLELSFKIIQFQDLLAMTPEDWWITLNPGQDVEKDFSPWEIKKLSEGPAAEEELLEDLLTQFEQDPLALSPINPDQHRPLVEGLLTLAHKFSQINKITLVRSGGEDASEDSGRTIIAVVLESDNTDITPIKQELKPLCELQLGTEQTFQILWIKPEEQLQQKLIANFEPIFLKKTKLPILTRLQNIFRGDL